MPTFIGARLRELRIAVGLSQSEVAAQVGVTKGRVSQWETDEEAGIDSLARLEALARVFSVEVADLLVPPKFTPAARVQRRPRTGAEIVHLPVRVPPELLDRRTSEQKDVAAPVSAQAGASPLAGLSALQQAAVDAFCKACRAGRIDEQQTLAWLNEWHALLSRTAAGRPG